MIWLLICLEIKRDSIITELLIRARKLDMSLVFITQSYFVVPKDSRLNSIHYFVVKNQNKRELQQIDATTNQNKILETITVRDDNKNIYKDIFDKLAKEKFDETK